MRPHVRAERWRGATFPPHDQPYRAPASANAAATERFLRDARLGSEFAPSPQWRAEARHVRRWQPTGPISPRDTAGRPSLMADVGETPREKGTPLNRRPRERRGPHALRSSILPSMPSSPIATLWKGGRMAADEAKRGMPATFRATAVTHYAAVSSPQFLAAPALRPLFRPEPLHAPIAVPGR